MTVNKAQGQSLNKVLVALPNNVFSHGQLYVALSRCTSSANVTVSLTPGRGNSTLNIHEAIMEDQPVESSDDDSWGLNDEIESDEWEAYSNEDEMLED
ncbi:uncharacterized protein MELLADRAFT_95678 [Melampsora larici-populina 98AG31]|uniref:DNA replication helicase domain-containing protein n=1 Tax=Melampsora larici-populina (strain 98AG31 / pathotype 3-4-7) TaxID=747676 RepID=F4SA76_MELLP|nr:uncharacterized protein MELLADRAFT_95678 [Melampsora larici-populina 98AG31]EGF98455.1 hypothetical protein MELLADRAFT_95678 [Melampsora larici-populina 98AG31]